MHVSPFIFLVGSLALIAIAMSSKTWAAEPVKSVVVLPREEPKLDVDFASGNERDRVSVSLATSELLVRLGEELQLRCEVSSPSASNHNQPYATPEAGIGVGVALRFKFR